MEENTTPQTPDLVESNNEVTPPPHKSMLAYIVIGLVILAAGLVGGFYARNFFPEQRPIPPLEEPDAETQARFDKENEEYAEKLKKQEMEGNEGNILSTVSGKLCYPSDHLPQGNIVAKDIQTKELFTQKYPGSGNGGKSTFDMELPEGTYIFRYEAGVNENKPDEFLAGYYTQCATITDRGCLDTEHQLIQVQVSSQSVAESISLCDFYYSAEPDF